METATYTVSKLLMLLSGWSFLSRASGCVKKIRIGKRTHIFMIIYIQCIFEYAAFSMTKRYRFLKVGVFV